MTWLDMLARMGETADRRARNLLARYERGLLDRDTFVQLAAALIAREQGRAVSAADLAVAATIAARTGVDYGPVGLRGPQEQDRLRDATTTVLDDRPATVADEELSRSRSDRFARLARAETLAAGQLATQVAWSVSGVSREGWVRRVDANPCPLCRSWNDGVARPWTVRMNRHPGCACVAVPVTLDAPPKAAEINRKADEWFADLYADLEKPAPGMDAVLQEIADAGLIVT